MSIRSCPDPVAMLGPFLLAIALSWAAHAETAPTNTAPALRALFLGDSGHHRPAERAAQLMPAMATHDIEITYVDTPEHLRPEILSNYDALILYANYDEITPPQEEALLNYVEGGGGFIPLHCAAYCFRNSDRFVALVGGQFARHGTDTFVAEITDREHPITATLLEFRTWDETYVHTRLSDDRQVLMQRMDDSGTEPYTWTRTQGKGRIFYTAYGHDEQTFAQPGFQTLVARGIRWAAQKLPDTPKAPFTYQDADIAFYPPKEAPHLMQAAPTQMQLPLSPADSLTHLRLPPDFEAKLVVAEPHIVNVIAMNWDERGRLWVAETIDYPNDLRPPPESQDRIKICEDTDGDGVADTFTVFADHLSIPTSLVFANGGLLVAQAPDTLFFKDTDGDDVADERTVLFTGWGTADTHSGPSNLRLGLDNWIWGTVGYSGFAGVVGGQEHRFPMGVFRFRPDGSQLEFIAATNNNTWGLGLSETGDVFASTANGNHSDYVPIPNRYYESVRGYSGRSGAHPIHDHKHIHPITDKVRQVDWHEQFTAAAGCALYTARNYPAFYWNRVAFITEPTGHLIHQCILEPEGSGYRSRDGWNFFASADEWTAPIAAEVGPDGNVWVSDWYNYIVQHNPTPKGFENGAGNAYVTPLRDKSHGRIYRVVYGEDRGHTPLNLHNATPELLLAALRSDNLFWRSTAQRIIVEDRRSDLTPALVTMVQDPRLDAIENAPGALHALAALEGLGYFHAPDQDAQAVLQIALEHPAPAVQRLAASIAPRVDGFIPALTPLLDSPDPKLRRSALLALADCPPSPELGVPLLVAATSAETMEDPWIADALLIAAARHDVSFLHAAALGERTPAFSILEAVSNHYARGGAHPKLDTLLQAYATGPEALRHAFLRGLSAGWPADAVPESLEACRVALKNMTTGLRDDGLRAAVTLARAWGVATDFDALLSAILQQYQASIQDSASPVEVRTDAAQKLLALAPGTTSRQLILAAVTPTESPQLTGNFIQALREDPSEETASDLLARLDSFMPSARHHAIDLLLARTPWSIQFLEAIENKRIAQPSLSVVQRNTLLSTTDKKLRALAEKVLAAPGDRVDSSREAQVDALLPLLNTEGDLALGAQAFQENCVRCHAFNGEGGHVGPDLTGIVGGNREEILIALIDPNRSVEGNFRQWTVETNDGYTLSGLLTDETQTAFTIHDALGNAHAVLREDVASISPSELSVMPEGFEALPPDMIAGLLRYLTEVGDYVPLDLRATANTISTVPMFTSAPDPGGYHERLIFERWGSQTFGGVPYFILDPQGDTTPNVLLLEGAHSEIVRQKPAQITLPCGRSARAIHMLSGISGWGHPMGTLGDETLCLRLRYADGGTEDHSLKNGVHFADYIRVIDVPESTLAFTLGPHQVRQLTIYPKRPEPIADITFIKGNDPSAPVIVAITVETGPGDVQ